MRLFALGVYLLILGAFAFMASGAVARPVACQLEWQPPTERENGDKMERDEIGGYEIRINYPDGSIDTAVISDRDATGYDACGSLDLDPGPLTFDIAAYDIDGLYSEFVSITPTVGGTRPAPVTDFRFYESWPDPEEQCPGMERCTIIESRWIIRSD